MISVTRSRIWTCPPIHVPAEPEVEPQPEPVAEQPAPEPEVALSRSLSLSRNPFRSQPKRSSRSRSANRPFRPRSPRRCLNRSRPPKPLRPSPSVRRARRRLPPNPLRRPLPPQRRSRHRKPLRPSRSGRRVRRRSWNLSRRLLPNRHLRNPAPVETAAVEQIPEPVPEPLPQEPSAGDDLFMDVAPGPVEPVPEPDLPPSSRQAPEPSAENNEADNQPASPPRRGWWSRG